MTRIEEIEDRLASITPQPWEEAGIQLTEGAEMVHGICAFRGDSECIVCHSDQNSEEPHQDSADMYFIARAPADMLYLIAEVKRMREALEWLPIEQAPDGVPVRVRQGDWYGTARFNRRHAVGHWTDGASILHYNGTVLVSSFRFSPGAEFQHITPPDPVSNADETKE